MVDVSDHAEEEAEVEASQSPHGDQGQRQSHLMPTAAEMALYPEAGTPPHGLSSATFADTPSKGKYGDPMDPKRWAHYMSGARKPPQDSDHEPSNGSSGQQHQQPLSSSTDATCRPEPVPRVFQSTPSQLKLPIEQWTGKTVPVHLSTALGNCTGSLHVPSSHHCANRWLPNLEQRDITVQFPPVSSFDNFIRFPIFMPSSGRPSSALLDLSLKIDAEYLQVLECHRTLCS